MIVSIGSTESVTARLVPQQSTETRARSTSLLHPHIQVIRLEADARTNANSLSILTLSHSCPLSGPTRARHTGAVASSISCHSISFSTHFPYPLVQSPWNPVTHGRSLLASHSVPELDCGRRSRLIILRRSTLTERRHPMNGGSACRLVQKVERRTVMISILEGEGENISIP